MPSARHTKIPEGLGKSEDVANKVFSFKEKGCTFRHLHRGNYCVYRFGIRFKPKEKLRMDKTSELENIVNSIRANKGQNAILGIQDSANLRSDLGFDSFDLAELTVNIEDKFGVDVFEEEIVETFGQLRQKLGNCK